MANSNSRVRLITDNNKFCNSSWKNNNGLVELVRLNCYLNMGVFRWIDLYDKSPQWRMIIDGLFTVARKYMNNIGLHHIYPHPTLIKKSLNASFSQQIFPKSGTRNEKTDKWTIWLDFFNCICKYKYITILDHYPPKHKIKTYKTNFIWCQVANVFLYPAPPLCHRVLRIYACICHTLKQKR